MGNTAKVIFKIVGLYVGSAALSVIIGDLTYKLIQEDPIGKGIEAIKRHKESKRKVFTEGDYDYYVVDYEVIAEY